MKFRKLIAAALAAIFCVSAAGCSEESLGTSDSSVTDVPADDTAAPEVPTDKFDTSLTALELTADIRIGWNLGNTLDANGGSGVTQETSWGNPKTTQELIQGVKDAGFNAVRIPTTWEKQMDDNNVINTEWMARVKEIVDYAYSLDMYVILNMHHEEWYQPYADKEEEISAKLTTCWTQIAEEFKGYDQHLIFEGMNEPRWKNTQFEWNGGNDEGRQVVNHLNKVFVDAVRATGGNNQYRFLMVCPYAANSSESALSALELPDDDRLIVSVHAYIPYSFALQNPGSDKWVASKPNCTNEIDTLAEVLDRLFISKGQAVIIGECGAMNRQNEEYRAAWAEYYFSTFKKIGVPCFWWDNGAFMSGETFGLFDRYNNVPRYKVLTKAMMNGADGITGVDYSTGTAESDAA
ncbi:MAG: glycoside hydrolase family 5 protein [Oscillospiraceae bacterium]|nr:glycoside hydrolase family 5 protein [Oscillospiraceae bacterium]